MSLGKGGDTESTTTVQLSPEQQQLISQVTPIFQSFLDQPPELFPGSAISPFTPLQELGQFQTLQAGQGPVQDIVSQLGLFSNFLTDPNFINNDPTLGPATEAAFRPLEQSFQQQLLPSLARGAQTAGQVGSSREGIAQGLAGQELLAQEGDISAQLAAASRGQNLEAATRALAFGPATAQAQTLPGVITEAVGGQQQFQNQAFLTEAAQRFLQEQLIPFQIAQDVASIAFGFPGGTATSQQEVAGPGALAGGLGGAGLAAALGFTGPYGLAAGAALGALLQ